MQPPLLGDHSARPGLRVLTVTPGGGLWAGRGYEILFSPDHGRTFVPRATYDAERWQNLGARWRLSARLLRSGFHDLVELPDGSLVGVVPRWIVHARPGSSRFERALRVRRGTRPLALALAPEGLLYFGEYFANPQREEVYVYVSTDGGRHWEVCYVFPRGRIRHVHRLLFDPFRQAMVVLTGDETSECKVLLTTDGFRSLTELRSGGQEVRAVTAIPIPEGLILPTDTPLAPNFVQLLDYNGRLTRLCPLPGSAFYACSVLSGDGVRYFVSTGVEPSRINTSRRAALFMSTNVSGWTAVYSGDKDLWPGKYFQYGAIILPGGAPAPTYLYATTVALRQDDNVFHRWRLSGARVTKST